MGKRYYINVGGFEDEIGFIYERTENCRVIEITNKVPSSDMILYEWHSDSYNQVNKSWYIEIEEEDYIMLKRLSWLVGEGEADEGYYDAIVQDVIRISSRK